MNIKNIGIHLVSAKSVAAILFASPAANAALIASDSFLATVGGTGGTYSTPATPSVYGQNPTAGNSGFASAWTNTNVQTTSDLRVETGGLSHPLVPNPAGSNDGNVFATEGTSTRSIYRPLSTFSGLESTYYMSSLMSVGSVPMTTRPAMIGLGGTLARDVLASNGIQVGIDDGEIQLFHNDTSGARIVTTIYSGLQADITYQSCSGWI